MNIEKQHSGNEALTKKVCRTAIYCRLSKDDELDGTSASIENQSEMLTEYCFMQGWQIVGIYADKNVFNEMYSKDISCKVHSSYMVKRRK